MKRCIISCWKFELSSDYFHSACKHHQKWRAHGSVAKHDPRSQWSELAQQAKSVGECGLVKKTLIDSISCWKFIFGSLYLHLAVSSSAGAASLSVPQCFWDMWIVVRCLDIANVNDLSRRMNEVRRNGQDSPFPKMVCFFYEKYSIILTTIAEHGGSYCQHAVYNTASFCHHHLLKASTLIPDFRVCNSLLPPAIPSTHEIECVSSILGVEDTPLPPPPPTKLSLSAWFQE